MWQLPKESTAVLTMRSPKSFAVTSPTHATARPPKPLTSATASCAGPSSRSLTTSAAPSRASRRAMLRPMPRPEPVTIATRPSSCAMGSSPAGVERSGSQLGVAVIQDDDVALGHEAAERKAPVAFAPDLGANCLAGIDRRREPHVHALQPRGIVFAGELEQCVTRDAVGAESMQDGLFESARARNLGIGMQRVEIAAQAVDQRRLRQRTDLGRGIGRALRNRVRLRGRSGRAAEAAVT